MSDVVHFFVIDGVTGREETLIAARRHPARIVRVHAHRHGEDCNDKCSTIDRSE